MDSLKAEVAEVFRTVITGDSDQIDQAINNYRDPYGSNRHYRLYQKKDGDGRNLLHYVCMYNTDEVATWMLSLRDDYRNSRAPIPKISDNFGATAVMYAASTGKVTFLKEWIKQKFNIKVEDNKGRNILNYFCGTGQIIPEVENTAGRIEVGEAQVTLAHVLMENGFDSYGADPDGMIPIKSYIERNFEKCLFLNQSDTEEAQKTWKKVYEVISVLITKELYSPSLLETGPFKIYGGLLHTAVALSFMYHVTVGLKERADILEKNIKVGKLDVNETDGDGMTALHHLCYYKYDSEPYGLRETLVAKLLGLGADRSIRDIWMKTPLICAIEKGYVTNDENDPKTAKQQRMGTLLQIKEEHVTLQSELNKKVSKQNLHEMYKELEQNLEEMKEEMTELKSEVKKLQDKQDKIVNKLEEQNQEISDLRLKTEKKEIKRELEMNDTPTSSLFLSNVSLTDVCRHLETDVEVTCLPGATLEDLQAAISKDKQKYKNIYLVTEYRGAGSDEDTDRRELYEELLKAAKNKCTEVKFSSVLPVVEDEDVNDKIKEINTILEGFCQEVGCVFIDNDRTFKYGDGNINEACFDEEGEHLSEFGIKRLLKNLRLLALKKKTRTTNI